PTVGGFMVALEQRQAATRRPPIRAVAGVALSLLVVAGVTFGLNLGGLRDRVLAREGTVAGIAGVSPVTARRAVAVLGFKNLSGRSDEAWLSTALSEMLTTELAAGEQLRTIPGADVARMKLELPLGDAESFAKDTLGRMRRRRLSCPRVLSRPRRAASFRSTAAGHTS